MNQTIINDIDPNVLTVEIWFKSDNMATLNLEVILGLSPYKLRKKSGVSQIQITYGQYLYCDSSNLITNSWYHFAFSI